MVRWPSGVTAMRQRAVGMSPCRAGVGKWTPAAVMSRRKTSPSASSATLPRKATRAPRPAATAQVLAAEPPLLSPAGGERHVEGFGLVGADEAHGALVHVLLRQEGVLDGGDDVDDGVADAAEVEARGRHGVVSGEVVRQDGAAGWCGGR